VQPWVKVQRHKQPDLPALKNVTSAEAAGKISGTSLVIALALLGNCTLVARQLPGGDDGLALSSSAHTDQCLHRQSGRLRYHGHALVYLGAPDRYTRIIIQLQLDSFFGFI